MKPAVEAGIAEGVSRIVPLFGQTMTFAVALQIIQPYQNKGSGTLIVLALFTTIAIALIATAQAYMHEVLQKWWLQAMEQLRSAVRAARLQPSAVYFTRGMALVELNNKHSDNEFEQAWSQQVSRITTYPGSAVPAAQEWYSTLRDLAAVDSKDEAAAILAPLLVLAARVLSATETVMVQFASVSIGTLLVQEASDLAFVTPIWTATYAVFGFALACVLQDTLSRSL